MFCTNCGSKVGEGVKFCTQCGILTKSGYKKASESTPIYISKKNMWQRFLGLVYPKVRQDKMWHRLIFVFGWLISIVSLIWFPITFIVYFGIIQRGIYFIVYGEDKSQWLIKS